MTDRLLPPAARASKLIRQGGQRVPFCVFADGTAKSESSVEHPRRHKFVEQRYCGRLVPSHSLLSRYEVEVCAFIPMQYAAFIVGSLWSISMIKIFREKGAGGIIAEEAGRLGASAKLVK
jgi:hypothetical protein